MKGLSLPVWSRDLPASIVVFLVAMPLCMGIAVASGVPAERGLITGIVGGIVVGMLSGSPLQVSGPAAGLAVIVFDAVQRHGLEALGPILLLAGALQFLAGVLRVGGWFRAMSPAVVHGMLSGIGLLIVLAQVHVLIDAAPLPGGLENLAAIPGAFADLTDPDAGAALGALAIGLVTMLTMLAWDRFRPGQMRLLPGALLGVLAGTAVAILFGLAAKRVEVPDNIAATLASPMLPDLGQLADPALLLTAVVIATIASAETLLSAAAVDRMHDGPRTLYNKELRAHGVGNALCGLLGALPMTGVIVRSSANVQAGAATRWSAVLHGVWILGLVALLPMVLRQVPTAALAGVLIVTGWRLIGLHHVKALFHRYGALPAAIWVITFLLVVSVDLLTGVLVGLAMACLELIPRLSRQRLDIDHRETQSGEVEMHLSGSASFVQLPRLSSALERVPPGGTVHVRARHMTAIDHTCAEMLSEWATRAKAAGTRLHVDPTDHPVARRRLTEALAG